MLHYAWAQQTHTLTTLDQGYDDGKAPSDRVLCSNRWSLLFSSKFLPLLRDFFALQQILYKEKYSLPSHLAFIPILDSIPLQNSSTDLRTHGCGGHFITYLFSETLTSISGGISQIALPNTLTRNSLTLGPYLL